MVMMSPRRSAASASLAALRRCSLDARACVRSRSVILARNRANSIICRVGPEFGADLVERLFAAGDGADQTHHRAVGLVLGEGPFQQLDAQAPDPCA